MTDLALLCALALAAGPAPDLRARAQARHGGDTHCAACHTAEGWKKVTFAHDRTGFTLTGRHLEVSCAACHPGSDFTRPLSRTCSACHRDVHLQRLGERCDRCHEFTSWKEVRFGIEAHRRTGFPLSGRHAAIPCDECHGNVRDRSFLRPIVSCVTCHQKDYDGTAVNPQAVNHAAAGFSTDCRGCHGVWRFIPGKFAAHDACFAIDAGPHAGISCRLCHDVTIPPYVAGQPLTCNATPAPDCIRCHSNVGPAHANVPGFLNSNPRCYECHRFASATGVRATGLRGVR